VRRASTPEVEAAVRVCSQGSEVGAVLVPDSKAVSASTRVVGVELLKVTSGTVSLRTKWVSRQGERSTRVWVPSGSSERRRRPSGS
jgi:hypothetical protein